MHQTLQERIVIDPQVMTGKPVVKGTRIPVELIVRMVAQGIAQEEILLDYPNLQPADVQAALWYAVSLLNQEEVYPLQAEPV